MKNLSKYQYGLLKYVESHRVTLEGLQTAHGGTLGSALDRGYLARGTEADGVITIHLTEEGRAALNEYSTSSIRQRLHPGPLTDHCARMLRAVRLSKVFNIGKHKKAS